MRPWLSLLALGSALGALTFACADSSLSSFADREGSPGADAGSSGGFENDKPGAGASSPDLTPTDNGVILVHAAGFPAYRLCFESELDRRPQPDSDVMPDANVVGVEVGSAVRIAPLRGAPGRIWVFPEPFVRELSGKGISCQALIDSPVGDNAFVMSAITTDYSKGVHLLVLKGCKGKTALTSYTKAQCGQDYDENAPGAGNLSLFEQELKGATRTGSELPTQVVHLAQPLESARAGATLAVSFGDVETTDSKHTESAVGPTLFNAPPLAFAKNPSFDPTDDAIYAKLGFRVTLTMGANPPSVVAQQSLADVQKQSAPRDIPGTYYAAASNYVLLLLGDPAPKMSDGGPDDDPLRKVHLLAVPVIEPKADGGADGGEADGGAPDGAL